MGTINYYTSDYITIGYNCNIDSDPDEVGDCYEEAANRLKKLDLYYWHVSIKPGYYEGFTIDLEFNFPYCFDNCREKLEALQEVTQIKKFLIDCVEWLSCCAVSPGWCTRYADYNETLKEITRAASEMRADVKKTPTLRTLTASEKIPAY